LKNNNVIKDILFKSFGAPKKLPSGIESDDYSVMHVLAKGVI